MTIAQEMLAEMQQEGIVTRKMLALVPLDNKDWVPHEKSMKLLPLARHLAEIQGWPKETVEQDQLDFANMDYTPPEVNSTEDLLAIFDKGMAKAKEILERTSDADLDKPWSMRNGEIIYFTMPKKQVMRTWVLNHTVHHRAQLGVYLRLLGVAIPGTYGPSADEG